MVYNTGFGLDDVPNLGSVQMVSPDIRESDFSKLPHLLRRFNVIIFQPKPVSAITQNRVVTIFQLAEVFIEQEEKRVSHKPIVNSAR